MMLDHALWNANQTCVIIAQTNKIAEQLLENRVLFAYERMPDLVKHLVPLEKANTEELTFKNNSSIRIAVSARGDAVDFLHVSEYGKLVAQYPVKAKEVREGAIQAVTPQGFCHIESTAEGPSGDFYTKCQNAMVLKTSGKKLTTLDYRFIFSGWTDDPVTIHPDPESVPMSDTDLTMFAKMEEELGEPIPLERRAWYVAKRDAEFASDPHGMLKEYPTTPEEAFRSTIVGRYYAAALAVMHREGRVVDLPISQHIPVNAMFDLGASDFTTCWLHQRVGSWDHFINYKEEAGVGFLSFIKWIEEQNLVVGKLLLPHDAQALMKGMESPVSLFTMVRNVKPSWDWVVVPRIPSLQAGIDQVRMEFYQYRIDPTRCKVGLQHLREYQRKYSSLIQGFLPEHLHDEHSHCADAFRQLAQARAHGYQVESKAGMPRRGRAARTQRASGMTG